MTEKVNLPMVQSYGHGPQHGFGLFQLVLTAPDIRMQLFDGTFQDVEMVKDEISQIIIVSLGVEKSHPVFHRRFLDDLGYRQVFAQPEALLEHGPVKKRAGGPAIAVHKGMVIGQPEVEYDRPNYGMNKIARNRTVCKTAHRLHAIIKLMDQWWIMKDPIVHVSNDNGLVNCSKTSNGRTVVKRFVGYEVPYRIRFDALQKEYTEISDKMSKIEQKNRLLVNENQELTKRLETEVGAMKLRLEKLTRDNRTFRDAAANRFIKWFLAGAGVLFVGVLLGYAVKRERRQSYLL